MNLEENFEYWLAHMDDALTEYFETFPADVTGRLDYSPESLDVLEKYLLEAVPTDPAALDGAARYVGETFRRNLGGQWQFNNSDPKNAFYGIPQLVSMRGQTTQIAPRPLVTAALDRKSGSFLRRVYEANAKDAS